MFYDKQFRLEDVVGNLAVVATIFQFLSGALACKQYVHNKTTGEASALPYLLGLLSCGIWYWYGTVIDDYLIAFVNSVGFILMLSYVIVFNKYAFKKKVLRKQILVCVVFIVFMYGYLFNEEDGLRVQSILGRVACSLTLLTVAAPLVKLYHVIKVKNTECLPYYMILMSFFVSGLWMVYGILQNNPVLIAPNIIGAVLAACQLSLFMMYPHNHNPPVSGSGKTLLA